MSDIAKNRDWTYLKNRKLSNETKQKLSDSKKGKPGYNHTIESKAKIGFSNKGKSHTTETKQKISQSKLGIKLSEETKQKLSIAHKGRIPVNKGVPNTAEHNAKISLALKGKKQSPAVIEARVSKLRGRKLSNKAKDNISAALTKISNSNLKESFFHDEFGFKYLEEYNDEEDLMEYYKTGEGKLHFVPEVRITDKNKINSHYKQIINKDQEIKEYLDNRYKDGNNDYCETIYRI
jgi:hypothetical protein